MSIVINGQEAINGLNVVFRGGRLTVDGIDCTPATDEVKVEVHGRLDSLNVDAGEVVHVKGNTQRVSTSSANIECHGNILKSAKSTSGDIHCGRIGGDASTVSGDVRVGSEPVKQPPPRRRPSHGSVNSVHVFQDNGITVVNQVGNNLVSINGVRYDGGAAVTGCSSKRLELVVAGDVDEVTVGEAASVVVEGDIQKAIAISGSVYCRGSVASDADTISGDIVCTELTGRGRSISGDVEFVDLCRQRHRQEGGG